MQKIATLKMFYFITINTIPVVVNKKTFYIIHKLDWKFEIFTNYLFVLPFSVDMV